MITTISSPALCLRASTARATALLGELAGVPLSSFFPSSGVPNRSTARIPRSASASTRSTRFLTPYLEIPGIDSTGSSARSVGRTKCGITNCSAETRLSRTKARSRSVVRSRLGRLVSCPETSLESIVMELPQSCLRDHARLLRRRHANRLHGRRVSSMVRW